MVWFWREKWCINGITSVSDFVTTITLLTSSIITAETNGKMFIFVISKFSLSLDTYSCRTCHHYQGWSQSDSGRYESCGCYSADRCQSNLQPSQTDPGHMHGCALSERRGTQTTSVTQWYIIATTVNYGHGSDNSLEVKRVHLEVGASGGKHAARHRGLPVSPPGSRSCWSGSLGSHWSWGWGCLHQSWWRTDSSQIQSARIDAQSDIHWDNKAAKLKRCLEFVIETADIISKTAHGAWLTACVILFLHKFLYWTLPGQFYIMKLLISINRFWHVLKMWRNLITRERQTNMDIETDREIESVCVNFAQSSTMAPVSICCLTERLYFYKTPLCCSPLLSERCMGWDHITSPPQSLPPPLPLTHATTTHLPPTTAVLISLRSLLHYKFEPSFAMARLICLERHSPRKSHTL